MTVGFDGPSVGFIEPGGDGGGTDLSPIVTIASRSDLIAVSDAPRTGPVYTVSVHGQVTAPFIPLLDGESIVLTMNGRLSALGQGGGFTGNFDGVLVGGIANCTGLVVQNNSVHADAYNFGIATSGAGFASITHCASLGPAGGVLIVDCALGTVIEFSLVSGSRGIVVTGAIGNLAIQTPKTFNASSGVEVEGTTVITGGLAIDVPTFIIGPAQFGVVVSDAVTGPGACVQVGGAKVSGTQGNLFRQAVGDMALDDNRLLVFGCSSDNWVAIMDATRTALGDPLIVPFPVTPTAVPIHIPYWTGAGAKIAVIKESHWVMTLDDPDPGDMYFEYTGEKANSAQALNIQALIDRNAGTDPITLGYVRDTNPPTNVWSIMPATFHTVGCTNSFRTSVQSPGDGVFNKGDRVRPAAQNEVDPVDTRIFEITLSIRGV